MTDIELYNSILYTKVSQNCLGAAEQYFELIEHHCTERPLIAHSLLRVAMRPVFYLGCTDLDYMLENIVAINKGRIKFLNWINERTELVSTCLKELIICCYFYELEYNKGKNVVVLNHKKVQEMAPVFTLVPDKEIYKEFKSFEEFSYFFHSFFVNIENDISELKRIIQEENYFKLFANIKASV